jgi:hypothetical protein
LMMMMTRHHCYQYHRPQQQQGRQPRKGQKGSPLASRR